jgi:hypothetical protein
MRTWTIPDRQPAARGPWTDEPDKAQWVDEATGLDCLIVRNRLGALCGYVGVPPEHPAHGKDYYDMPDIEVHGGLTYADRCQEGAEEHGICHVPEPGRPADVWWFGFDCGHCWDLVPGIADALGSIGRSPYRGDREVYRDFTYVQAEVAQLARQLAAR